MKNYAHRWSGWPGAYCLKCGINDLMEMAIANNLYDPYTDKWENSNDARVFQLEISKHQFCKMSDQDYEEFLKRKKQC